MFTSNTAEHDAANQRLLQKSAEPKTLSAAFVATFVGSGIFRLRLRQSLRRRCKTSTFATGSGYPSRGDEQRAIRGNECHHELGRSSAFRPGRGRGGVLGGEPSGPAPDAILDGHFRGIV